MRGGDWDQRSSTYYRTSSIPRRLSWLERTGAMAKACLLSPFPSSVQGAQKSHRSLSAPCPYPTLFSLLSFPSPSGSLALLVNEHVILICPGSRRIFEPWLCVYKVTDVFHNLRNPRSPDLPTGKAILVRGRIG